MVFDIFTIGHSNMSISSFLGILQENNITKIIDVRSYPYSRFVPHFNSESLRKSLEEKEINYIYLGETLGGKSKNPAYYINRIFNYDLYMGSPMFIDGINRILHEIPITIPGNITIMCSEGDPFKCHRTLMISKFLRDIPNLRISHIDNNKMIISNKQFEDKLIRMNINNNPGVDLMIAYHLQSLKVASRS